jgi:hypothetical protein
MNNKTNKDAAVAAAQADDIFYEGQGVALSTSLEPIMTMFKAVNAIVKNPQIRLRHEDEEIRLALAAKSSRNPGYLYVKVEGEYIGKISPAGVFRDTGYAPDYLIELLSRLAADPLVIVAEYGKLTGACSFCGRTLTDPDSKRNGYGPVCAEYYGLMPSRKTEESTPSLWSERSEGNKNVSEITS